MNSAITKSGRKKDSLRGFRAVLFRMVPKLRHVLRHHWFSFRAVLFRMVPKPFDFLKLASNCFRAVLFRMVPKRLLLTHS